MHAQWEHERAFFAMRDGHTQPSTSTFECVFPDYSERAFENEGVCTLVDENITYVKKDHPVAHQFRNMQKTGLMDHVDLDSPRYAYSTGWFIMSTPFYRMVCEAVRTRYIDGYREAVYLGAHSSQ